ncbi:group 1 truncated hemoglobin [Methylophilaceae bacterium]|jgi:hemoglobin|nr:group 1 truncated hemoglobin [Methylophilaceae bacterium]MDB4138183.1 group 1 truncated hemoglobin [Methylophilaceae bacterium]
MSKSIYIKIVSTLMAIFIIGSFSTFVNAADEKSLYSRLGGTYNIALTVDHLVDKIYVNKALNANPALKAVHDAAHTKVGFKVMLTNWVVERTGGPKIYMEDEFGRGKNMKDSHPHLNISDREFDIIMIECLHTFYAFNVPDYEISQLMGDLQSFRKQIVTKPIKGYKSPYNSPFKGIK